MTSLTISLAAGRSLLHDENALHATRSFPFAILGSQCHCFDVGVERCSDFECRKIWPDDFRSRLSGIGKKCRHLEVLNGKSD